MTDEDKKPLIIGRPSQKRIRREIHQLDINYMAPTDWEKTARALAYLAELGNPVGSQENQETVAQLLKEQREREARE